MTMQREQRQLLCPQRKPSPIVHSREGLFRRVGVGTTHGREKLTGYGMEVAIWVATRTARCGKWKATNRKEKIGAGGAQFSGSGPLLRGHWCDLKICQFPVLCAQNVLALESLPSWYCDNHDHTDMYL